MGKKLSKAKSVEVSVIIPWRDGTPERERNLKWILTQWNQEFPEWEVLVAPDAGEGPWRKGVAFYNGVAAARGRVIILADADSWSEGTSEAVKEVRDRGAPWFVPQTFVVRLTSEATTAIVEGGKNFWDIAAVRGNRIGSPVYQATVGGMLVLSRGVAEKIPIDPRFGGWGGEDLAHRYALECLIAKRRRVEDARLIHLWHPPADGRGSPRLRDPAARELQLRYARARHNPKAMKEIIGEARAWLQFAVRPSNRSVAAREAGANLQGKENVVEGEGILPLDPPPLDRDFKGITLAKRG